MTQIAESHWTHLQRERDENVAKVIWTNDDFFANCRLQSLYYTKLFTSPLDFIAILNPKKCLWDSRAIFSWRRSKYVALRFDGHSCDFNLIFAEDVFSADDSLHVTSYLSEIFLNRKRRACMIIHHVNWARQWANDNDESCAILTHYHYAASSNIVPCPSRACENFSTRKTRAKEQTHRTWWQTCRLLVVNCDVKWQHNGATWKKLYILHILRTRIFFPLCSQVHDTCILHLQDGKDKRDNKMHKSLSDWNELTARTTTKWLRTKYVYDNVKCIRLSA